MQEFGIGLKCYAIEPLMFAVIKPVARQLSDDILDVVQQISSTNSNVETSLLIAFIILLFLAIVFFIFPYMNSIRNDVIGCRDDQGVDVEAALRADGDSAGDIDSEHKVHGVHREAQGVAAITTNQFVPDPSWERISSSWVRRKDAYEIAWHSGRNSV